MYIKATEKSFFSHHFNVVKCQKNQSVCPNTENKTNSKRKIEHNPDKLFSEPIMYISKLHTSVLIRNIVLLIGYLHGYTFSN